MRGNSACRVGGLVVLAVGALGLAACGESGATGGADSGVTTLKLGYATAKEHPYGLAVDFFVKELAAASGGKLKVDSLPNYAGGDAPLLDDVSGGTVEMASVSSAVFDTKGVTDFQALQIPFLMNRYDLERSVITGDIGKAMLGGVDKVGLVGLAIHEGGLRKPLAKDAPILTVADWKGKKTRSVQSDLLKSGLSALGATPTPTPVTEIYSALKSGVVDSAEANLGLINSLKLYEQAKFTTLNINLWPFPTVLVMNKVAYDKLGEDQKAAIKTAADKVPGFSIEIFTKPTTDLVAALCGKGMKFAFAKPEDIGAMAAATKSVTTDFGAKDPKVQGFIDQIQALKNGLPAPTPAPPPAAACLAK